MYARKHIYLWLDCFERASVVSSVCVAVARVLHHRHRQLAKQGPQRAADSLVALAQYHGRRHYVSRRGRAVPSTAARRLGVKLLAATYSVQPPHPMNEPTLIERTYRISRSRLLLYSIDWPRPCKGARIQEAPRAQDHGTDDDNTVHYCTLERPVAV